VASARDFKKENGTVLFSKILEGENKLQLLSREKFMSMNLSTPYQITKMLGELYCNFFYNHYSLKVVKPRFFNSYGSGEIPGQSRNVIPNFIY
jgi:nucleoside-diphosphate-sugar epimerase